MMLIMIFSACRLAELARIELPTDDEITESTIWLHTVTKQKATVRETIVIRTVTESALCPVHATQMWLGRRATMGLGKLFLPSAWHAERAGPREELRANDIAERFKRVLRCANIPPTYSAYSIKHAVITKLFRAGATDAQVVEFGRWAKNSKTPRTWYNIETLEKDWLGTLVVANMLNKPEDEALESLDAEYLPATRSAEEAEARGAIAKWLYTPLSPPPT
jgi:lipoate synthase